MLIDYAGMNAAEIAGWLLIATAAGFVGRVLVKGKSFFGLWGDAVIGLLAVFLLGTVMRALNFDLTNWIGGVAPASMAGSTVWIDIALSALLGAILIRAILRPFTGAGGGGH
jgi:uncharacterized membrane protein YeaQ/YmgE (transglycosylase-associated protein family)